MTRRVLSLAVALPADPPIAEQEVDRPGGYAVSTGRRGIGWRRIPEAWKRHACLVSGRKTAREWKDALPDRPYRTVS